MAVTSKYRVMSDDGDSDHDMPLPMHASLFPSRGERLKKNTPLLGVLRFDKHFKQAKF